MKPLIASPLRTSIDIFTHLFVNSSDDKRTKLPTRIGSVIHQILCSYRANRAFTNVYLAIIIIAPRKRCAVSIFSNFSCSDKSSFVARYFSLSLSLQMWWQMKISCLVIFASALPIGNPLTENWWWKVHADVEEMHNPCSWHFVHIMLISKNINAMVGMVR